MTDRLPSPVRGDEIGATERASATPANLPERKKTRGGGKMATDLSLTPLQTWLVSAITNNEDGGVDAIVTPGPRMTAQDRLGVYQSAYHARLVECLRDDYPTLAAALGEDRFHAICHEYLDGFPSASPNLNAFGRHMARVCRASDALSPEERSFFADLATLEWAMVEVIHAETPTALDGAKLASMPPEAWGTAHFEPSEAARVLHLAHPVSAFLTAQRQTGEVPRLPTPAACQVAVYRQGPTVWRMDLTPAMARVLSALLARETIGASLEAIGTDESDEAGLAEAERSVMVWFREWVSGGLFADVQFGG